MKKKLISIVLVMSMLVSVFSVTFTASAGEVSNAQWNNLIVALKTDTVKNLSHTGEANNVSVVDTDGSIITAVNALYSVISAMNPTDEGKDSGIRTSSKLKAYILSELQSKMSAADFSEYNINISVDVLLGKPEISDSDDLASSTSDVTSRLIVNKSKTAILSYNTLNELPDSFLSSVEYSLRHSLGSYQVGSGCSSTTKYFLRIREIKTGVVVNEGTPLSTVYLKNSVSYLNSISEIYNSTVAELLNLSTSELESYKSEVEEIYDTIINDYGLAIYSQFIAPEYNLQGFLQRLNDALMIYSYYIPLANSLTQLATVDFSAMNIDEMTVHYNELRAKYDAYVSATQAVRTIVEEAGFDFAAVNDYKASLLFSIETYNLNQLRSIIELDINEYSAYNYEMIGREELTSTDINLAIGKVRGYIDALSTYQPNSITAVFDYDINAVLSNLYAKLNDDLSAAALSRTELADKYAYYITNIYSSIVDYESELLLETLITYDSWFAQLNAFTAAIAEDLGEAAAVAISNGLAEEISNKMNGGYNALYARLSTQVYTAIEIYESLDGVSLSTLKRYKDLKNSIALIDTAIYDFLSTCANYSLSSQFVADYNSIGSLLDEYNEFMESYGLESYEAIEIEDIVRRPNIGEIARNADYVVTDDKVMQVIDALDKMLISDEFKSLTGGKTLRDVLSSLGEKVYTDAFLNTILQYVYPLVANEFVKVWADLPESVEVDNPIFSGKLDVSLSLYTVEEAMKSIQVYVFPKILGEQIRNSYPEVAQKLMSVTEGATLQYNPWNDAAICDEDGKLALDWGITDRESFIAAATAGLKGLEPLLLALLANKQINNSNLTIEEFMSSSYTSRIGCGKVGTGSTRLMFNVTIDPIVLYLDVQGNSGYNNAIVPILEALSLPAEYIPDGNSFASVEDIIRYGLIEPISMALELLADAPIDFVTKALPNICYALELNMIPSLLSMLKTSISYRADAHYNAIAGLAAGNINNALVSDAPIGINIGEMLDLSSLGLDLSSLNGLLSLVEGLVDGLELPPIDGARFAGMGELEVRETRRNEAIYSSLPVGSAYFIKANQADVLIELLRYVINAVATDPSLIASLASAFGAGDDFVLPEAVDKIIFNVCHNTNDALAAVVELVLPQEYAVENGDSISWPTSFAMNGVSYPTDAWTKEKAKYVADNLPTFIDDILILTGIKIDGLAAENLNLLVEALLNKLYSPDLLNSLAQKLSSGLGSILPESLADILTQQLGVDFSYWYDWSCDFEVGDSAAFIDAACDLFSPFDAVLGCLLCNEDLVIRVNDENSSTRLIHVKGHDGYSFGLLPILEAIGAEMPSHAELIADRGNLIRNILNPIADRLEAVKADPYNSVADIVANVLYFASCDALEISMSNLLHAVYVVLDTISPVYKLNLNDLLGFDLTSLSGDYVVSFVATKLSAVIYDATGLRLYFDFSAGDLLSELGFGNLVPFTSANGSTSMRVDMTNADYADSLTVLLRYLLKLFVFSENAMVIAELCRERFELPDVAYAFLRALAFTLMNLSAEHIDYTLGVLFWIFYGADTAADAVAFAYSRYGRYDWEELVNTMTSSEIDYIHKAGYLMVEVYKTSFIPLYDDLVERYDIPINGSQITSLVKLLIDYIKLFKEFFEKLFGFLRAPTA